MEKSKRGPKSKLKKEVIETSLNDFTIENFLPSLSRVRKPEMKDKIIELMDSLKIGQSFFIPTEKLHVGSVRKIVLPELKNKKYKDIEIRIVANKKHELSGCRVARFR